MPERRHRGGPRDLRDVRHDRPPPVRRRDEAPGGDQLLQSGDTFRGDEEHIERRGRFPHGHQDVERQGTILEGEKRRSRSGRSRPGLSATHVPVRERHSRIGMVLPRVPIPRSVEFLPDGENVQRSSGVGHQSLPGISLPARRGRLSASADVLVGRLRRDVRSETQRAEGQFFDDGPRRGEEKGQRGRTRRGIRFEVLPPPLPRRERRVDVRGGCPGDAGGKIEGAARESNGYGRYRVCIVRFRIGGLAGASPGEGWLRCGSAHVDRVGGRVHVSGSGRRHDDDIESRGTREGILHRFRLRGCVVGAESVDSQVDDEGGRALEVWYGVRKWQRETVCLRVQ
mmetsp:Transcript_53308/g.159623  ORF Transcript_53308/g.159623 Transcript_53308/m.159623 type:complete len:341 (-) Transcript_53308:233-1255(-)